MNVNTNLTLTKRCKRGKLTKLMTFIALRVALILMPYRANFLTLKKV